MTGKGHPLPGSDEARHSEIPEHLEREKGQGDDAKAAVQPAGDAVAPDGEPYPAADLGRSANSEETDMQDERRDDPADGPRGQPQAGQSGGGRQVGGGPEPSDMAAPGGSSGEGGYGNAENKQHQGPQDGTLPGTLDDEALDRSDRFDEQQGGGRGPDAVGDGDELQRDQAEHQDRGQSVADAESGGG